MFPFFFLLTAIFKKTYILHNNNAEKLLHWEKYMVFVTIKGQFFFIHVLSEGNIKYSKKINGVFDYILYFSEGTTIFYGYINRKNIV